MVLETVHNNITTATYVGTNRHLLITNTAAPVAHVGLGAAGMGVPVATTGIPLVGATGSKLMLCTGDNEYVRADLAAVHCVVLAD